MYLKKYRIYGHTPGHAHSPNFSIQQTDQPSDDTTEDDSSRDVPQMQLAQVCEECSHTVTTFTSYPLTAISCYEFYLAGFYFIMCSYNFMLQEIGSLTFVFISCRDAFSDYFVYEEAFL